MLQGLELTVEAATTVALVGPSGGGKSTCFALLERWYDPAGGRVTVDDHDLVGLCPRWLRTQVGLVAQEPALFAGSVSDNVAYGARARGGGAAVVSAAEVEAACAAANAAGFIEGFPRRYAPPPRAVGSTLGFSKTGNL